MLRIIYSVQNYNLRCIYTCLIKQISGLIVAGQVAPRQFWRVECRPCQRRSIRNLPMSEWHRNQSLCQQCSAKQAHMLHRNPSKGQKKERRITHQTSWTVRIEEHNNENKILNTSAKHNSRSSSASQKALPCDLWQKKRTTAVHANMSKKDLKQFFSQFLEHTRKLTHPTLTNSKNKRREQVGFH